MPLDSAPSSLISKPDTVRVAVPADCERLFDLLWNHLQADNDMGMGRSAAKVRAQISGICYGKSGIAGLIELPDGELVGSIGIQASQTWYSDAWYLSETWLFVRPGYRKGTNYGRDLFEFAKWHRQDMSQRLGVEMPLEISVYSFRKLDAKTRYWRRHARHVGSMFWIEGEGYHDGQ